MNILRTFFDRPIRTKISAGFLLLLLGVSTFNFLFFPVQQRNAALEEIKAKGETIASLLAGDLTRSGHLEDRQSTKQVVERVLQDQDISFVQIVRFAHDDTLFYQSARRAWGGGEPARPPLDAPAAEGQLHIVRTIQDGHGILGTLTLGISPNSPRMKMAQKRRLILAVDFLILVLGMLMAHYISGFVARPIRRIARAADELSEGEWGVQVPLGYSDEIGVLGNIFNRMSQSLKESKQELEEYSRTLEQKVEERTAELTDVNRELAANEATITKMLRDLNSVNGELGQTKSQLENIFKSVVDRAIITISTEGKITFYSKSSELIFGYEVDEVVGRKYLQEFFASESDFTYILLEHTREAGIYKGEVELIRRGKQSFAAIVTITPLKGEEGALTGYTLIVEDITQKKKTEENIRLLSFAVESATDGAVVVDLNGRILFVNQSHARMHGYEPYEMIGKLQNELYPRRYWPMLDLAIQQIFADGCWSAELEEPKKDGSTFPAQISSSLIKDPEGRPVGILGICQDISEKKEMEQEILQSNRELSALNTIASTVSQSLNLQEILSRTLTAILELTRCPAGWILLVDQECKSRMKLAAHQGLSRSFVQDEDTAPRDDCLCWEVVKSKEPRLIELTNCPMLERCMEPQRGLRCHISVPLRSKDEVLGVMNLGWACEKGFSRREREFFSSVGNEIGIAVDNALLFEDVQRTKDKLQKLNRRLEEASQIKSEFLANTSHELRTPLNSIIGFLGLALDGYCANSEEEREFLRNAQQSAKHLLAIINDVLDLAKIEAGRMELELGEVDLPILFDEVQSLTQVQAQQKNLSLKFVCQDDPAPRAYADPGKLRQVMVNLIGNAIKFTDQGTIVARATAREEKGNVLIEVEDTGVGIPADVKDKLFEKFRQVDGSSTRKHGGTGLGLTITKNLVEIMGGMIKLESRGKGQGTAVSFTVPLHRETEEGESAHRDVAGAVRGETQDSLALIVEDDPSFGSYLEELMRSQGLATALARNADDAVNMAKDLHPQVLLLDFSLPQKMGGELKDGAQVVRMLQKDASTRDVNIIVITGQDAELVQTRLSAVEPDQLPPILSKPVDRKVLLDKIGAILLDREHKAPVG
jgi:PAS domain S-box-containing protein